MSRIEKPRTRSQSGRDKLSAAEALSTDPAAADPLVPVFLRDPRDEDRLKLKRDKQRSYDRRRRETAVDHGDTRLAYRTFFSGGLLDVHQAPLFAERSFNLEIRKPHALMQKTTQTLAAPDFGLDIDLDAELAQRRLNHAQMPRSDYDSSLTASFRRHSNDVALQTAKLELEALHESSVDAQASARHAAEEMGEQQISAQMFAVERNKSSDTKSGGDDMLENIRKKYANLNVKLRDEPKKRKEVPASQIPPPRKASTTNGPTVSTNKNVVHQEPDRKPAARLDALHRVYPGRYQELQDFVPQFPIDLSRESDVTQWSQAVPALSADSERDMLGNFSSI